MDDPFLTILYACSLVWLIAAGYACLRGVRKGQVSGAAKGILTGILWLCGLSLGIYGLMVALLVAFAYPH